MKCILRRHIYICLALLPGCGYVFDPETFTFVEAPVDAVSTDTQGEQSLSAVEASAAAEPAASRDVNRRSDNDRSSPRSDDVSDEGEATEDTSSTSQPSSGAGSTDDSSATPSQPSSDDDDDTSPSVPDTNTNIPDVPSRPGDGVNINLGGGFDPLGVDNTNNFPTIGVTQ